jgi:hypothetical protein
VAHSFQYVHWVAYLLAGIGAWKYLPLVAIRLVAAFTSNDERARRCLEVLRLARRDASSVPTYLPSKSAEPQKQEDASGY